MSDGEMTPGNLLKALREEGFRVIALTDHNHMTIPHELQKKGLDDMIIFNGVELSIPQYHIVLIDLPINKTRHFDKRDIVNSTLSFIAHPIYTLDVGETFELAEQFDLDGIEKYNRAREVFLDDDTYIHDFNMYATDDIHIRSNIGHSWIEIETDSFDRETILEKLKDGDYYIVTKNIKSFKSGIDYHPL